MKEIGDFGKLEFKGWNNVRYDGKEVGNWWGKTYFYYDKSKGKLLSETFSPIARLLHRFFGYKKEFNRTNFWDFLTDKKFVKGECPKKEVFRKIVGDKLGILSGQRQSFFTKVDRWNSSEDEMIKLLENIPDVDFLNAPGKNALFEAARHGRYKVVEHLLDRGADVNPNVETGLVAKTPLQAALSHQHEKMILLLLEKGADVNAKDFYGDTALHLAIKNLDVSRTTVRKIYAYPEEDKEPPKEPKKIIQAVLAKNPDINAVDQRGHTPLYYACEKGDLEVVKWLIDQGADVNGHGKNDFGRYGIPPLYAAIEKDNLELVRFLVDKGANVNISDETDRGDWETPLTWAVHRRNNAPIIELLIDKGADIEKGGGYSKEPPLHAAVLNNDMTTVKLLISRGANINATDMRNRSVLLQYLTSSSTTPPNVEMVKFLLENGADPNIEEKGFRIRDRPSTPLHSVVLHGNKDLTQLLLDHKANINIQDFWGLTPLHVAAAKGLKEMVEFLLQQGADPNCKDKEGKTPADLAREEIASLIRSKQKP